jgi:tRNA A-37 threonylcarbamoyl transferase component Bud32
LFFSTITLDDDSILIINNNGSSKNSIKLVRNKDVFKVIKSVSNKELIISEKKFYNTYKKNDSIIKLPQYRFLDKYTLECDFVQEKTFQRMIIDGTLSFESAMKHFYRIKKHLPKFYMNNKLIHGDLAPINIFISKNNYYLIDFSDSERNIYQYDLYVLLFSILFSYKFIDVNEKSIETFNYLNFSVYDLLSVNRSEFEKIEALFRSKRKLKHPSLYNY